MGNCLTQKYVTHWYIIVHNRQPGKTSVHNESRSWPCATISGVLSVFLIFALSQINFSSFSSASKYIGGPPNTAPNYNPRLLGDPGGLELRFCSIILLPGAPQIINGELIETASSYLFMVHELCSFDQETGYIIDIREFHYFLRLFAIIFAILGM